MDHEAHYVHTARQLSVHNVVVSVYIHRYSLRKSSKQENKH